MEGQEEVGRGGARARRAELYLTGRPAEPHAGKAGVEPDVLLFATCCLGQLTHSVRRRRAGKAGSRRVVAKRGRCVWMDFVAGGCFLSVGPADVTSCLGQPTVLGWYALFNDAFERTYLAQTIAGGYSIYLACRGVVTRSN